MDDEKGTFDSIEGGPARNIVSESGLYSLVLGSRKPEAKAFKRWFTKSGHPRFKRGWPWDLTPRGGPGTVWPSRISNPTISPPRGGQEVSAQKGNPGQRSSRGPFAGRESARRQDGHCLFDWFLGNHGAPMVGLRKPIKYAGNGNPWRRSTRGTLAGRLDDRRQDEILPTRDNLMGECWRASHSSLAPARVYTYTGRNDAGSDRNSSHIF